MNPFTLWMIAHHAVFKEVLSRTSLLCDKEVLPHVPAHSVEDALVFYEGKGLLSRAVLGYAELLSRTYMDMYRPWYCKKCSHIIYITCSLCFADVVASNTADLPLWQQTDGAVEWIQKYLVEHNLSLPSLTSKPLPRLPDCVNSAVALSATQNEGIAVTAQDLHEMYMGMFQTAFDIIAEQQA